MNSNKFHLAIEVDNLKEAIEFYINILGCEQTNEELPNWVDINFWGNELTLHASSSIKKKEYDNLYDVDMGQVIVPHFGVHLDKITFDKIKFRLKQYNIEYVDPPYIRFEGTDLQQETFFIKDPSCNIIELKNMNTDYPEYLGLDKYYMTEINKIILKMFENAKLSKELKKNR